MTTARLPEDIEQRLDTASRAGHTTKSEYVKEALVQYLDMEERERTSWETGEPFFGRYGSGDGTLSATYKDRLREKINAKYHSH
jgi:Arc/MetJ-type ribon-helix-helix transcriptional regulator